MNFEGEFLDSLLEKNRGRAAPGMSVLCHLASGAMTSLGKRLGELGLALAVLRQLSGALPGNLHGLLDGLSGLRELAFLAQRFGDVAQCPISPPRAGSSRGWVVSSRS